MNKANHLYNEFAKVNKENPNTEKILDYLKSKNSFIFGSYIYKKTLRNEDNNDIDVAVPYSETFSIAKHLKDYYNCKEIQENYSYSSERARLDCDGTKFDLVDDITITSFLHKSKCDVFKLVVDKKGFGYINDYVHRDADRLYINRNNEKLNELINNIKQKKYDKSCLGASRYSYHPVTNKYKEYFRNWTKH